MRLHEDEKLFMELIVSASKKLKIKPEQIENDYYIVTKDLLYDNIEYEEAINGIYDVIGSKIFELPQSEKERIKS